MNFLTKTKRTLLWFLQPKRYRHLYSTIRAQKPVQIMEIGTWNGERAVKMLNLAGQYHAPGAVHYHGFDLFEEMTLEMYNEEISKMPPTRQEVQEKLEATGANIHLYQGNTTVTLPESVPNLPPMDFVFLDGGHSVATIANDWACVEKVMHDKTVVIFDDYWVEKDDEGAKAVVDQIDRDRYEVTILEPQDRVKSNWGPLKINFARVVRRAPTPGR